MNTNYRGLFMTVKFVRKHQDEHTISLLKWMIVFSQIINKIATPMCDKHDKHDK